MRRHHFVSYDAERLRWVGQAAIVHVQLSFLLPRTFWLTSPRPSCGYADSVKAAPQEIYKERELSFELPLPGHVSF